MREKASARLEGLNEEIFEDWFLGRVKELKSLRLDTAHPNLGTYEKWRRWSMKNLATTMTSEKICWQHWNISEKCTKNWDDDLANSKTWRFCNKEIFLLNIKNWHLRQKTNSTSFAIKVKTLIVKCFVYNNWTAKNAYSGLATNEERQFGFELLSLLITLLWAYKISWATF